jgi:endonuclease/exonuclease/phosphatase family metal-dependent hydrolase
MARGFWSGVAAVMACGWSAHAAAPLAGPASLSVLTYNVEGLPWPARSGRGRDLAAMAERLRQLRAGGRQPHVVVLQEAFTAGAKQIVTDAGYRYVADGPGRDDAGAEASTPEDAAFVAAGSSATGEGLGKWSDSGLRIASDYPIVAVRRMPFPSYACAGFDCLANKGVLIVYVAVPGAPGPVAIVATHLNSRHSSHVDDARSLYAYRRQLDAMSGFLARTLAPAVPVVMAGDFNAGTALARRSYLIRSAVRWRKDAPVGVALDHCMQPRNACALSDRADLQYSLKRGRDWQFFAPGAAARLVPTGMAAPFGHAADGAMLSDHVGYVVVYSLRGGSDRAAPRIASRG